MKVKPCPYCECARPLLLDVARRAATNELIYRHRCSNCGAHTLWCNNETASLSLWEHGDIEK